MLGGGKAALLVPYDCDRNHEPCDRGGVSAHWALIAGFLLPVESNGGGGGEESTSRWEWWEATGKGMCADDPATPFYLVAYHGKSRHPALWRHDALTRSNAQLSTVRSGDGMRQGSFCLPSEGISALRGKCLVISRLGE